MEMCLIAFKAHFESTSTWLFSLSEPRSLAPFCIRSIWQPFVSLASLLQPWAFWFHLALMPYAFLPLFFAVFLSQLLLAIAWPRLSLPTDRSPWSSEVTRDPICFFVLRWSPRIHHWGVWVAGSSIEAPPCSAADASALRESGKGIRDAKSIGCLGCCYCSESKGRCCCH